MKFKSITALATAGLMLSTFTWLVAAQTQPDATAPGPSGATATMAGMSETGMHPHAGMMRTQDMQGKCGMMSSSQCATAAQTCSPGKGMMGSAIANDDPAALLNLKDQLNLTADQQSRLQAIAQKAQTDARSVLTPDQLARLKEMPATCGAMAAACGPLATQCATGSAATCNLSPKTAAASCPYMQSMMAPAKSGSAPAPSNSGT